MIFDGDTVIVNTGTGDDKVQVTTDPATGEQVVTVNGVTHRYPPDAAITIRTGEGNDEIAVDKNTRVQLTLMGGKGDDTIHGGDGLGDTILGGAGRDHLYGGFGADRISGGADRDYSDGGDGNDVLSGGHGNDTIYGMGGDDAISGGDGQDYLEGAKGDDTISGGTGNDAISGGLGDDKLFGGAGDDKLYGGFGSDALHGGTGNDDAFAQTDDTTTRAEKVVTVELKDLGSFIEIDGSPEFVARTEADLDMLRSSPRGQEMLAALDAKNDTFISDTITIKQVSGGNEATLYPIIDHSTVDYNPGKDSSVDDRPPVAGLYHELAHVYDHEYGTGADGTYTGADNPGVPNDEREAVGLPIDHDDDPGTPDQPDPDHPWHLTENGLREELGVQPRPRY
jgi:Ca2+-binding RTX toxin-like protein